MPLTGYIDPSDSVSVTINGTDYTRFLSEGTAFDIQQTLPTIPRADERRAKFEPMLAIGSIQLFADQESLTIDWETAITNDLKEGRQIVITTQYNTYNFRVRNWDVTEQDACTGTIKGLTVNITDKLGLINRQTKRPPLFEYLALRQSLGIPTEQPYNLWNETVQLVALFPKRANDQPYLTTADLSLPSDNFTDNGFLDTERLPDGEFNAAEAISSILYARGYGCYCDPADEVIKASAIPLDVSAVTPDFRWDCRQLISFAVDRGTEEPVDRVEASVQSVKSWFRVLRSSVDVTDDLPPDVAASDVADTNAVALETWPKTFPINMNGDDIRATRTEQQPIITSSTASYSYSETGKKSALFPGNTDDTNINYLTGTLERKGHPTYKFAISEVRTEQVAKGLLSDDIFPESEQKAGRRLERYWKVSNLGDGGDGILTHEYEQLYLPTSVVLEDETLSDVLTIQYEEGSRYVEYSPRQWARYPYRNIADLDNLSTALIPDPDFDGAAEFLDGVPSPPVHPVEDVEAIEVNSSEANAQSSGDSDGPILIVKLNYGNRESLARTTADVSLALSQWNRIVYDVRRPEQATDAWQPYRREDAANAGMVKAGYVLQYNVSEDGNELLFGFTGLKAVTLEKPITIEDADAGQLPSETNVTPIYQAIERAFVNDDLPALRESASIFERDNVTLNDDLPTLDETISIAARDNVRFNDDLPALNSDIDLIEPGSLTIVDDLPALSEAITLFERQTVAFADDLPLLDESITLFERQTATFGDDLPSLEETIVAGDFDADAQTFIGRLTGTYSQVELDAINAFFVSLKTAGLYSTIDALYIFAVDSVDDALLNLVDTNYTATRVNLMTFTARQGFTGNGSNMYLNTNFAPLTAGGNYAQNSATIGVYIRNNIGEAVYDMGAETSGSSRRTHIAPRWTNNQAFFRLNSSSFWGPSSSDSRGLTAISRTSITASASYKNGSSTGSSAVSSQTLTNQPFYIGALNSGGSIDNPTSKQIAAAVIASGWDATQNANFFADLETLLDAFGAGVIT